MKSRSLWMTAAIHAFLSVVCVAVMYPVLWVVKMAVSPSESLSLSASPIPDHVTMEHFATVMGSTDAQGHWGVSQFAQAGEQICVLALGKLRSLIKADKLELR